MTRRRSIDGEVTGERPAPCLTRLRVCVCEVWQKYRMTTNGQSPCCFYDRYLTYIWSSRCLYHTVPYLLTYFFPFYQSEAEQVEWRYLSFSEYDPVFSPSPPHTHTHTQIQTHMRLRFVFSFNNFVIFDIKG